MIGDVNLFLKGLKDEEDFEAEVEIMIAGLGLHCISVRNDLHARTTEPSYRRKGLALSSLQLFLSYATSAPGSLPSQLANGAYSSPLPVQPSNLVVRISASNSPSINMFTKLGFVETKRVEVFNEVEMRLCKAGEVRKERMGEDSWSKGTVVWYE
jgi:RimJ/RimL family protein N-acetyltransferase